MNRLPRLPALTAKRIAYLAFTLTLLLMATPASASSAHWVKGPTASLDTKTGNYVVSFKEAGLGGTPVTYKLDAASATFTFQCYTKSGNTP